MIVTGGRHTESAPGHNREIERGTRGKADLEDTHSTDTEVQSAPVTGQR